LAETLLIAAPASNTGKTLITLSLLALMKARGVDVAAAKVGPDYIDPAFHAAASGNECVNLDPWAMGKEELAVRLARAGTGRELLLIEGVMGLFDGAAASSGASGHGGSTADLAAMFSIPVVLVLDCARQGQSVAAVAQGFARFRADVPIAGFILNRVATERHGRMLQAAIEEATGLPVCGKVMRHEALKLAHRHLGLVQAGERADLSDFLARAAQVAARDISTCRLAGLTRPVEPQGAELTPLPPLGQRIAIARDEAFGFCYPHWLDDWRRQGAEISFFSPLADEAPAMEADAVFLPGGYPELHAGRLAAAARFKAGLRELAARGALVYGECGGFMALGEVLEDAQGAAHAMAGLLPVRTSFARRRLHLGYRALTHDSPLPLPARLMGHEFHYASASVQGDAPALFHGEDSQGRLLAPMGLRTGRVMGSFAHVICAASGGGS